MNNNYKSSKGVLLLIIPVLLALLLFPVVAYASSPVVTGLSPLNNSTNVSLNGVFSLNFDQNIEIGLAGKKIRLIDVATENILYSAEISSDQISIVGAVISWTLPAGVVDYSKNYYINMEPGAVKNEGDQYFVGMSYASWKITTKADNEAPVLVSSRPADGISGYYEKDGLLIFEFDEPVQAGSGLITIKRSSDNALAMSVDVTNSEDINIYDNNRSFQVLPTDVLDLGTEYYVEVADGAIEDLLGNAFGGIGAGELSFTMRTFVDTEASVVSSFLPADDATDVAIDTDLSIIFDEDVQKGTGSIFIKSLPGGAIVHIIDLTSVTITDNTASFSLPSDLSLSTGYFITMVAGVFEDTSGNEFAGFTNSTTWSFTTGSGLDTTPPTVTSLFPLNESIEVGTGNIEIFFDYFVQKGTGTIYLKDANTDVVINSINVASESVNVRTDSYFLRLDGFINYTLTNREFYIEMGSGVIQDLAGNDFAGLAKGDWQFKTEDTNTPVVINSSPATRSKGITLDATITFTANEPLLQPSGGFSIVKLLVEEALNPIEFFSVVPGVPRTSVHYVPTEDITVIGNTVSFDLPGSSIMDEGAMYYISSGGGIIDLVRNQSIGIYPSSAYLFKTLSSDVTGPIVSSTDPVDNAIDVAYLPSLTVTFDEPIVKTTGNILFYRASDDGVDRQINILSPEVVISGSTMTITPNTTFQPNTELYFQMGGVVADYQDNLTVGISGTDFSFTTVDPGDVTSPTVVSLFPSDNATAVPVGSEFTILFNEAVKLSGAGNISFRRVSGNSALTFIDVLSDEVSVVGNSLTIKPSANIAPDTEFYIQMSGVVQDASDNYFVGGYGFEDYSWSFTTSPDVTPPNLLSTYPTYGETDVPVDANFTMQFDERVLNFTSLLLYSASDDEYVHSFLGSQTVVGGDGYTQVTINPSITLLPGKEYYIKAQGTTFVDLYSNLFAGIPDGEWSFTTAGVDNSDNDAPVVQSFSPVHLSTTFAISPKLSITFDEPIATGSGNLRLKDKSNDNIIAVVSINSATISDATITFDPGVELAKDGNAYYVIIDNGAITDLSGNAYAGIADNTTWNFSTSDNELPFIITKSPSDGNGEVANSSAIFDLTFNENIAEGTGSLSIYNYNTNQLVEEFEMGVSAFYTISDGTITLNSQLIFSPNTHYYIRVDNGAIEDTSDNIFGGMFGKDDWDFTTAGEDIAPLLSGTPFSPVDGATSVGISDNLVITFNEDIQASLGGFAFLKYAAGTTREV
ncbi:MAG: Ig-like domain-containing protein, partial [Reichenbachiella sp.]